MQVITTTKNDINKRIDNLLLKHFNNLTRGTIYKLIRSKQIKINNRNINYDYRIQLNDVINISLDLKAKTYDNEKFLDCHIKPNVVYEDENIIIVNKPVGLVVHDDETNSTNTLINCVKNYLFKKHEWNCQQENTFAPALVHRLDRNTKGLVIIAKNALALAKLNELIKKHLIKKFYHATVHGIIRPKSATLKHYLTNNKQTRIVKITNKPINSLSREIITKYTTIKNENNNSYLDVELITGRTHQIRAHFAYVGFPLVGERKYSNAKIVKQKINKYQDLCAYKIIFAFDKNEGGCLQYLQNKIIHI